MGSYVVNLFIRTPRFEWSNVNYSLVVGNEQLQRDMMRMDYVLEIKT